MTADQKAALYEIRNNLNHLFSNLIGLEHSRDWDSDKIVAAKQVLGIVEQLIEMAKNGNHN